MLNTKDLQQEIIRLKKEQNVCILAHSYQSHDILEIADITGDSFQLSQKAAATENKRFLFCGVRFMAETAKILAPDREVILVSPEAGCPMAEQMTRDELIALKEQYPDHTVVSYINTTAALKTVTDVCITSSSAVEIVSKLDNDKIIFIPDCNLGAFVQEKLPQKTFVFIKGGCPVHSRMTAEDVKNARARHPDALLLVHPECPCEVTSQADYAGSTAGIMSYAKKSNAREFIIGTENSIVAHLQFECPDKCFYPLSKHLICADMKLTALTDVYNALLGRAGEEIVLDADTIRDARHCIDEMIRLG